MRAAWACLATVLVSSSLARADEVGIIVTGDEARHDELASHVKSWLRKRGHAVSSRPLDAAAIQNLTECLAVDDQGCARGVIDKQAATDSVVFASIQPTGKRSVSVQTHWFLRGRQGPSERRACEKCTEEALAATADDMLLTLAKSAEQHGRLVIRSHPEDLLVLVDNEAIGQTPVERDLPPGKHRVVIMQGGENVGERTVEVEAGEPTKITLTAHRDDTLGRKVGSVALITGGFGLLVTAGIMISYGTKDGPGEMYVYDNATGIGLISGGIGLLGIVGGALLWPKSAQRAVPVAAMTSSSGFVGLAGRF